MLKAARKINLKKKEFFIVFSRSVSYAIYVGGQMNPTSVGFLLALAKEGKSV